MPDTSPPPPCYCITGHGRSGTSFLTAMLQSAGLDVGERLNGPCEANPRGHFEDMDFHEFHVAVLASQGFGVEGYILEPEIKVQEQFVGPARAMVELRRRAGRPWGWKEPRSTLFLDFWRELIPESRFLLLFRRPWDVIDSLFRRGDSTYTKNPGFAVQVLQNYNRAILDFHDRFPDRCLLIESFAAAGEPRRLIEAVTAKFGDSFGPIGDIYEDKLFRHEDSTQQRSVLAHFYPETLTLYEQLRSRAALFKDEEPSEVGPAGVDWALQYWVDFRRLEAQDRAVIRHLQGQFDGSLRQAQAERERLAAELVQVRADASSWQSESTRLQADLEQARGQIVHARALQALVNSELEGTLTRLVGTESERDDARARLVGTESERDDARARLANAEAERDDARARLANAEAERDDARARLAGAEARRDDAEAGRDDARARLAGAEAEREHASQALQQVQAQLARVEGSRFWKLRRLLVRVRSSLRRSGPAADRQPPGLIGKRIDEGRRGIAARFGARWPGAARTRQTRKKEEVSARQ